MIKKVWIYQASDFLQPTQAAAIMQEGRDFLNHWTHHQQKVDGEILLLHQLFLILKAQVAISGCGVDKSMHFVQSLEEKYGVVFTDRQCVAYQKNDQVHHARLNELKNLYQQKIIDENTLFFDNLVNNSTAFAAQWQKPLAQSWHWRFCV